MTRPLRILFIIGSMREGGAEGQLIALMCGLRARGHVPAVMLLRREGIRLPQLKREGFEVLDAAIPVFRPRTNPRPWLALPGTLWRTISLIREFNPDVIHAWLFWAHLWAGLAKFFGRLSAPLATSRLQLPQFKAGSFWMNAAENAVNRASAAIVCNSNAVLEATRRVERNTRGRLALIHGGIDFSEWSGAARADLIREFPELTGGRTIVLCVASYVPCKGHPVLLRAWKRVAATHRHAKLLCIGGDGGELADLCEMKARLGLEGSVVFATGRNDVRNITQAASICVLPSYEEGFSNVILEAMACGKPVIATAVGGNPEAVLDEETGIVVPPRDEDALARALERLLSDADLRARMGAAGRDRVAKNFPLVRTINRHIRLYERMAGVR